MIPAHLTNGMIQTDDKETTRKNAYSTAKNLRAKGIFASVFQDEDTKKFTVWIPISALDLIIT